jgi:hypothetical protein
VGSGTKSRGYLAWPERWPVAGPIVGVGFTLTIAVVGGVDGDWVESTAYAVLAAVFGVVAARNSARNSEDPGQSRARARH